MARVIQNQRNPWGAQTGTGGEEAQRADLWVVDLTSVIQGISTALNINLPAIPAYFAQSVALPELRVKADQFRRDSRPYNMPGFDDPPDPVKINFILDAPKTGVSSRIYAVLDRWRSLVRAGRGQMSKEAVPVLNDNYRIDFQFNVTVLLLRGGAATINSVLRQDPVQASINAATSKSNIFSIQTNNTTPLMKPVPTTSTEAAQQQADANRQASAAAASTALLLSNAIQLSSVDNDLQYSGAYTLQNCWLGGFRITDLNYGSSQINLVEATLYAEDVFDQNGGKTE